MMPVTADRTMENAANPPRSKKNRGEINGWKSGRGESIACGLQSRYRSSSPDSHRRSHRTQYFISSRDTYSGKRPRRSRRTRPADLLSASPTMRASFPILRFSLLSFSLRILQPHRFHRDGAASCQDDFFHHAACSTHYIRSRSCRQSAVSSGGYDHRASLLLDQPAFKRPRSRPHW